MGWNTLSSTEEKFLVNNVLIFGGFYFFTFVQFYKKRFTKNRFKEFLKKYKEQNRSRSLTIPNIWFSNTYKSIIPNLFCGRSVTIWKNFSIESS